MCDDVSVLCWLKKLRYNFEYYEPYDVFTFTLDDDSIMEEPIYENIWQCVGDVERKSPELDLKYGQICRISVEFRDHIDVLEIAPFPDLVQVKFEVPDDVMLWKSQIRHTYSEEDQNILENQVKKKTSFWNPWQVPFF